MQFELMAEGGFSAEYVEELSPANLRHHYDNMIRLRSSRRREELNVQVAAAAVAVDGGKAAQAMDSALGLASQQGSVRADTPSSDADTGRSIDELAGIERRNAETAHLWREE